MTGSTDIPLEPEGEELARQLAKLIPEEVTKIYSSDLIRCQQTAKIANGDRNLPLTLDARLRERNFGSLEGKKIEELDKDFFFEADVNQAYDYRPFGGECADDVRERTASFIEDLLKNNSEETPLLVTSGGIIRLFSHTFTGVAPREIENCALHPYELTLESPELFRKKQ